MLANRSYCTHSDDLEAPPHSTTVQEKGTTWAKDETSSIRRKHDYSALVFTLNLCFLSAALAQFATLLLFRNKAVWDTGCGKCG